ncbi:hypothetical protein RA8CHR_05911 [Variovorax sp. RA8]|nr:hypothetical protein RA8CHR_05911 [Variovorax sp. RA8]
MMGDDTANALGSLLTKQATLVSVSFVSNGRRDDFFLKPLVEALRQNTTLLQLDVSKFAVGAWRDELRDHLARNRNIFKMAVANGMWHGLSVLLGGRFYDDIVNRIIDTAEFSDRDALALSSLHPTAWAERHKTLQMDGVPK